MLELPHAAVGAAIAAKIPNPAIALPLAFASHFVLDTLPHWNPHFFTETQKLGSPSKKSTQFAMTEFTIATLVLTVIAFTAGQPSMGKVALIFAGGVAGMLPDLAKIPYFFFKKRAGYYKKYVLWERSIQNDTSMWPGILTQLGIFLAAILWIIAV